MAGKISIARAGVIAASVLSGALLVGGVSVVVSGANARQSENNWSSSASADAGSTRAPKCLDIQHVGRIHVLDPNTLLVYDTWGNPFKLSVGGPCRSMTDMSHIGFEVNGTDSICRAHDAMILYSQASEAPVRCIINGVQPISRSEADRIDKG